MSRSPRATNASYESSGMYVVRRELLGFFGSGKRSNWNSFLIVDDNTINKELHLASLVRILFKSKIVFFSSNSVSKSDITSTAWVSDLRNENVPYLCLCASSAASILIDWLAPILLRGVIYLPQRWTVPLILQQYGPPILNSLQAFL